MNINPLFPVQDDLDKYIEKEKDLQNQDLKKKKIVALLTELYECVNEARFFKFWSKDQKARTSKECTICDGEGGWNNGSGFHPCETCWGIGEHGNPLLEEYVDTVHFIISVALEYEYTEHEYKEPISTDLSDRVIDITYLVAGLSYMQEKVRHIQIALIFDYVIALGYQLGFTEEQVLAAYYEKNKLNHERQETGY